MTLTAQAFQPAPILSPIIDSALIYSSEQEPSYDTNSQQYVVELNKLLDYLHTSYKAFFPFYENQYTKTDIEILPLETIEHLEPTLSIWEAQNSDSTGCLLFYIKETRTWQLAGINLGFDLNIDINSDERFRSLSALLRCHSYLTVNINSAVQSLIKKQIYSSLKMTPLSSFYENFIQKKYSNDLPFYKNIKSLLELIVNRFAQNDLKNRESMLKRTIEALLVCGPGIQTELMLIKDELYSEETLVHWLARIRKEIVLELAAEHCKDQNVAQVMQIHVQTAFAKEANLYSWHVPINTEDFFNEDNALTTSLHVTEEVKTSFAYAFKERYSQEHIFDWIIRHVSMLIKGQSRLYNLNNIEESISFVQSISPILSEAGLTACDILDEQNPTEINLSQIAGPILLRLSGGICLPNGTRTIDSDSAIHTVSANHFEQLTQIIEQNLTWQQMLDKFNTLFSDELSLLSDMSFLIARLASDCLSIEPRPEKIREHTQLNISPKLISQTLFWFVIRSSKHLKEVAQSLYSFDESQPTPFLNHRSHRELSIIFMLYEFLFHSIHSDLIPPLWMNIACHFEHQKNHSTHAFRRITSPMTQMISLQQSVDYRQRHFSLFQKSIVGVYRNFPRFYQTPGFPIQEIATSLETYCNTESLLEKSWDYLASDLVDMVKNWSQMCLQPLPELAYPILKRYFSTIQPESEIKDLISHLRTPSLVNFFAKMLIMETSTFTYIQNFRQLIIQLFSSDNDSDTRIALDLLAYNRHSRQTIYEPSLYYPCVASTLLELMKDSSINYPLCAIYISHLYKHFSPDFLSDFTQYLIDVLLKSKHRNENSPFRANAENISALADKNGFALILRNTYALDKIGHQEFFNTFYTNLKQANVTKLKEHFSNITWIMTSDISEYLLACRERECLFIAHNLPNEHLDTNLLHAELECANTYTSIQLSFNYYLPSNERDNRRETYFNYCFDCLQIISISSHDYAELSLDAFPPEQFDRLKQLLTNNSTIKKLAIKVLWKSKIDTELQEQIDSFTGEFNSKNILDNPNQITFSPRL